MIDFGHGGAVVGEDAGDELEGVGVPFFDGRAGSFELVVVGGGGKMVAGFAGGLVGG